VNELHGSIVFDCNNHGLENVDVPVIRDPEPERFVCLGNQPPTERNSNIAGNHSKDHWLPHPTCVSAFHFVRPLLSISAHQQGHSGWRHRRGKWYRGPNLLGAKYYPFTPARAQEERKDFSVIVESAAYAIAAA
jgi:hypothetical protein